MKLGRNRRLDKPILWTYSCGSGKYFRDFWDLSFTCTHELPLVRLHICWSPQWVTTCSHSCRAVCLLAGLHTGSAATISFECRELSSSNLRLALITFCIIWRRFWPSFTSTFESSSLWCCSTLSSICGWLRKPGLFSAASFTAGLSFEGSTSLHSCCLTSELQSVLFANSFSIEA